MDFIFFSCSYHPHIHRRHAEPSAPRSSWRGPYCAVAVAALAVAAVALAALALDAVAVLYIL